VYTRRERFIVTVELIAIMTLQWAIFHFVGGDFERFVFASPVAVLLTSSIVMSYIFTNHFLNPLGESSDPLANTTSIVVYRIFDRLHLNFSYHTEHHLFPGMNSDYYPKVSQLLTDRYGTRYNRISFGDAWNRLWKIGLYASVEVESDRHATSPTDRSGLTQHA
jgi:fatty acid desaturase